MVCDECIEQIKNNFIGKSCSDGAIVKDVLRHKPTTVFISKKDNTFKAYSPAFKLFIQSEKTLKNKNLKHAMWEQSYQSKFCPNCGKKLIEKENNE